MTAIDPENPVVKLCVAGVQAEESGDDDLAAALYGQAWEVRTDSLEASMAAHYYARVQADAAARMRWNMVALEHALAAGEAAAAFLPSLYLNVGHSQEESGALADAAASYGCAMSALSHVDATVAESLRAPIERAQRRTAATVRGDG